jgi:hypothetical protein
MLLRQLNGKSALTPAPGKEDGDSREEGECFKKEAVASFFNIKEVSNPNI